MRRCNSRISTCVAIIWLCWQVAGCGSSKQGKEVSNTSGGACIRDETKSCTCPDGSIVIQVCRDNLEFEQCPCKGTVGSTGGTGDSPNIAGGAGNRNSGGAGGSETTSRSPDAGRLPDASIQSPKGKKDSGTDGSREADTPQRTNCLRGSGDYSNAGPYQVSTKDVEIQPTGTYTLFYPTELEPNCPHPIVAWGNGTGVTGSETYAHFHNHAASWGIVTAASHSPETKSDSFLENSIDWLLAQNDERSSAFYHKLSKRAGTAGHSQGGRASTTATKHPNVVAEVCVQGAETPDPKAAFLCLTGEADVALERCITSYDTSEGPSFFADHSEADHMTTPTRQGITTPAGIQYKRLYTAWFRCFLADDDAACKMFKGNPCGICNEPGWARIEGKNM
jgi:hypothetical protein